jgi:hypothetical protein
MPGVTLLFAVTAIVLLCVMIQLLEGTRDRGHE